MSHKKVWMKQILFLLLLCTTLVSACGTSLDDIYDQIVTGIATTPVATPTIINESGHGAIEVEKEEDAEPVELIGEMDMEPDEIDDGEYEFPSSKTSISTLCFSGPGTKYQVVFSLLEGDPVTLLGINAQGDWVLVEKIQAVSGQSCWVPKAALPEMTTDQIAALPIIADPLPLPATKQPPDGNGQQGGGKQNPTNTPCPVTYFPPCP